MQRNFHQLPKLVTLQLLRAYKWAISPMFPPSCRYVPTCSEYAMEAIERFGVVRGGLKAFLRLLRCHPFAHGGHDPVIKQREQLTTNDQRLTTSAPTTPAHAAIRGNC